MTTMSGIHKLGYVVALGLAISGVLDGQRASSAEPDYTKSIRAIARDIEALKPQFPQLKEFSKTSSVEDGRLVIQYSYHTHRATHFGGWTSQVPNPDRDGVWFYIDLHAPDSTAQIDTQPAQPPIQRCLGNKVITFLILEGSDTKPLGGHISTILQHHGVSACSVGVRLQKRSWAGQ